MNSRKTESTRQTVHIRRMDNTDSIEVYGIASSWVIEQRFQSFGD